MTLKPNLNSTAIRAGWVGFGQVRPGLVDIALGSLQETENHVDEALERKYITPDEHARFRILAKRAIRAGESLQSYLRRATPPSRPARTQSNRANQNQPDRTRPNQAEPDETPTNATKPDRTRPNPTKP